MDNTNDPVSVLRAALHTCRHMGNKVVYDAANVGIDALNRLLLATTPAAIQHSEQRETIPAGQLIGYVEPVDVPYLLEAMADGRKTAITLRSFSSDASRATVPLYLGAPVAAPVPEAKAEQELLHALKQRDNYHDIADTLADAIASHLNIPIGEHSSDNNPWQEALMAIQNSTPAKECAEVARLRAIEYCPACGLDGVEAGCRSPNCGMRPTAPAVKHEASELVPATDEVMIERVKQVRQSVGSIMEHTARQDAAFARRAPPIAVQGSEGNDASALRYAQELAAAIWQKHYSKEAPQWKLLPDLYGALSQIDNMTTGMSRSPVAAAPEEVRKAALEEVTDLLDEIGAILQSDDKSHDFWMGVGAMVQAGENAIRALSAAAPSADAKGEA